MTRFPHGRWDREQPHVVEVVNDPPGCYARCSCGWMGELRMDNVEADGDAEGHERFVFSVRKAGKRLVRGRVE